MDGAELAATSKQSACSILFHLTIYELYVVFGFEIRVFVS